MKKMVRVSYIKYLTYGLAVLFFVLYLQSKKSSDLLLAFLFFSLSLTVGATKKNVPIKEMTPEELAVIRALILAKEKEVLVIKKIREYTNLGLLEAKNKYEELARLIG